MICRMALALAIALPSFASATEIDLLPAVQVTNQNACRLEMSVSRVAHELPEVFRNRMIRGDGTIYFSSLSDFLEYPTNEDVPSAIVYLRDKLLTARDDKQLDPVFGSAIRYLLSKVDMSELHLAVTGEGLKFRGDALGFLNDVNAQPGLVLLDSDPRAPKLDQLADKAEQLLASGTSFRPMNIYILGDRRHLDPELQNEDLAILFLLHELLHFVDLHRYTNAVLKGKPLPDYLRPMSYRENVRVISNEWLTVVLEIRAYLAVLREGKRLGLLTPMLEMSLLYSMTNNLSRNTAHLPKEINPLHQLNLIEEVPAPAGSDQETVMGLNFQRVGELDKELEVIFSSWD